MESGGDFRRKSVNCITEGEMDKRLVIIDGNSLMNRAFYALKRPMITKEGIHTGALYGFINMLEKIKKDYEPGYICVTFDLKAPTFRHMAYEGYKATRKPMALELAMQMPLIKDILRAMNIKILEMEGYEADDLIGTVARLGEEEGLYPLVITGDKDALQLAGEKTNILYTIKGISTFKIYDDVSFEEEYGFEPVLLIDYKSLVGDTSDNIPGVKGIGKVAATKLIKEYGTIENMYGAIDDITPKGVKTKLEEGIQSAVMSKKLATINRYVPVDIDFSEFRCSGPDTDALLEIYRKLEFNSFIRKMDIPGDRENSQVKLKEFTCKKCISEEDISEFISYAAEEKIVGMRIRNDESHLRKPEIYGGDFAAGDRIFTVDMSAGFTENRLADIVKELMNRGAGFYGHDMKKDVYALMYLGIRNIRLIFDTAIGEYVTDSSRSSYQLEDLSAEILGISLSGADEDQEQMSMGLPVESDGENRNDAAAYFAAVNALMEYEKKRIEEDDVLEVFEKAEMPLIEVMASMEYEGFRIDTDCLESIGNYIRERTEALEEEIYSYAGKRFNIKSPQQLGTVLFEDMGLTVIKKTKSGYATGAEILEKLKDEHPVIRCIMEYRKLTKLSGTYVDGMKNFIGDDGKIRCQFNQTATATGRISSSNPNMQNIPIREELGRKIRGAFVPESENWTLLGADYSQIELRVLAHLSQDQGLIESFNRGIDIHRATASRVMGIPEKEVDSSQRSRAKAVNFGVIYGMSSFGLSEELNITRKEAQKYINDYFENHPAVKRYMDEKVQQAREKGYVSTILGRRRYINEISASNFNVRNLGERLAMNTPIQGSAADIIKLAMIKVYHALEGYSSRLILQVHDELILQVKPDEMEQVTDILRRSMEEAMSLSVNLTVDIHSGENWELLK